MDTLRLWIAEGRISRDSKMIDPLDGRVMRAGDIRLLDDLFPAQAATAPPQFGASSMHSNLQRDPYAPSMYARPGSFPTDTPRKNMALAIVLALFLGAFGIHRFYLGHTGTGLAMALITILTCGYGAIITGVWAIVDIILIATGSLREPSGRSLA
jgi:TM2 domain-containing membrane protein YozV